jgi:hypothetical protein
MPMIARLFALTATLRDSVDTTLASIIVDSEPFIQLQKDADAADSALKEIQAWIDEQVAIAAKGGGNG